MPCCHRRHQASHPVSIVRAGIAALGVLLTSWQWIQPHVSQQKTLPVDEGWQGLCVGGSIRVQSGDQSPPNLSPYDAVLRSLAFRAAGLLLHSKS
jgi:hypothetical protein